MASVVERWAAANLIEVDLPSGFRIRMRPVSPTQLIVGNLLPYELLMAVAKAAKGDTPPEEIAPKESLDTVMKVAARAIREIWDQDAGAWEPLTVTAEQLSAGVYDPDDVDKLLEVAMSRLGNDEEGVSADDLLPFRDRGDGVGAGTDGGPVAPATLRDDRPAKPRARARSRRRAGAPAAAR